MMRGEVTDCRHAICERGSVHACASDGMALVVVLVYILITSKLQGVTLETARVHNRKRERGEGGGCFGRAAHAKMVGMGTTQR